MRARGNRSGFTLVEIMIVVAIIGLLAGIAVPSFMNARTKAQTSTCLSNLRQISAAKDQYAFDHNNDVPTVMSDLVTTYIAKTPVCPAGGTYAIGDLGSDPSCSTGGDHSLATTRAEVTRSRDKTARPTIRR